MGALLCFWRLTPAPVHSL
uniref:Uncharacterized protein n=1 Tax=Anguilla anguilla TaxID=7936 RepID=A0A0E9SB16_ANGAN